MDTRSTAFIGSFAARLIEQTSGRLTQQPGFVKSDVPDIEQELTTWLWTKSHSYDPQRGTPDCYATMLVSTRAAMEVRSRGRAKRQPPTPTISLEWKGHGGDTVRAGLTPDDRGRRLCVYGRPACAEPEFRDLVEAVYARTSPDERAFLMGIANHGVAGVARALGRTRRDVQRDLTGIRARFGVRFAKSCAAPCAAA